MKKYKEQKMASFQDEFHRWQLVQMSLDDSKPAWMRDVHYQIRKDRKVICNVKWKSDAKKKFANMISMSLNQSNLFS